MRDQIWKQKVVWSLPKIVVGIIDSVFDFHINSATNAFVKIKSIRKKWSIECSSVKIVWGIVHYNQPVGFFT